jgi:hypothetical protein
MPHGSTNIRRNRWLLVGLTETIANAQLATVTASVDNSTTAIQSNSENSLATLTGHSSTASIAANAGLASATATANDATVSTSSATEAPAGVAAVTTATVAAVITVAPFPTLAAVTASALKEDVEGVPDAILASANLTGAVQTLWDDPTAPDAGFLTAIDTTAGTDVRVSFPTPVTAPGSGGPKAFRIYVRRNASSAANPTITADIYESGNFRERVVNTVVTSTTGQLLTGTMNPALLVGSNGAGVELRVQGIVNSESEFSSVFPAVF